MSDLFTPETNDQVVSSTFEELVGEGKKYKSPEDVAKAIAEKDRFILQLQNENAEARAKIGESATIEEIMTQIRSMNQPAPTPSPSLVPEPESGKLDPSKLNEIVSQMLAEKDAAQKAAANKALVERTLLEKWGADANINLNKKASELGVSIDYLKKIAHDTPSVFFNLVGLDKVSAPVPGVAPRSSVQAPPAGTGERTKSHYDRLKAANPVEYFSPKIQNQMYKDAMRLGESFFDKD